MLFVDAPPGPPVAIITGSVPTRNDVRRDSAETRVVLGYFQEGRIARTWWIDFMRNVCGGFTREETRAEMCSLRLPRFPRLERNGDDWCFWIFSIEI